MSDSAWFVLGAVMLLGLAINALLTLRLNRRVLRVQRRLKGLGLHVKQESVRHFQQMQHAERLRWLLRLDQPLPPMRGWAASPDFLWMVASHALAAKPGLVLECGSGTSTVVLARCMALNGRGRVVSLEADGAFAKDTRDMLESAGLGGVATVIHAPLAPVSTGGGRQPWYATDGIPDGPIDMLIVDGPTLETAPMARYPAGPLLFGRMAPGGAVFLDDADRPDERAIVARWLREVPGLREGPPHRCEKGCVELRVGSVAEGGLAALDDSEDRRRAVGPAASALGETRPRSGPRRYVEGGRTRSTVPVP